MNPRVKMIVIGFAFIAFIGLGVFILTKPQASAPDPDDAPPPENVASVVTVQTGALKRMTLHRYVSGYGTVEAAPATADQPAADATVAPSVAGVVAKVNVVEGQQVQKGDVLVELNSGALTADYAQQEADRQNKLFAEQNTSQRNLQAAEAQLASLHITAPVAGTVTRLNVKPGAAVDVSTVVAEVMDLSRLAVSVEIPVTEADDLKTGEAVQLLTDPPVATTLSFISPAVSQDNDTIRVRALLPAASGLRPGQFVPLRIVTAIHTNCLAAPVASVVQNASGQSVIAQVKGDEAEQLPVQTGLLEDGWIEVTSPRLNADDLVVTVGAYGLPAKTKIQILNPSDEESASTNPPDAK